MRRLLAAAALVVLAGWGLTSMMDRLLNALMYFPSRDVEVTPAVVGLAYSEVEFATQDGERLHGWWIETPRRPPLAHVLLLHGNAGSIAGRVLHARLLADVGLDVFLFDYRGYGRSTGSPDEQGTYRDARAALAALLGQRGVDPARIVYLGESLGGAVALALALEAPPRGVVLQSTFTSVRDMGRLHYPVIPAAIVPDAYPNLLRIRGLKAPLLVLHGDRDDIVPVSHGRALFEAAPEPKRLHLFPGAGHNDLLDVAGPDYARTIAEWVRGLVG